MNRTQSSIVSVSQENLQYWLPEEINWKPKQPQLSQKFGHIPQEYPHYLVVDIYDVFIDFQDNPGLQCLYERFPLHRIIENILGQTAYNHDDQGFWIQLEDRFTGNMDIFDLDLLALFYESLAFHLDEVIRSRFREQFDTGNYIFSKWVGPTSLELRIDENNAYFHNDRTGSELPCRSLPGP